MKEEELNEKYLCELDRYVKNEKEFSRIFKDTITGLVHNRILSEIEYCRIPNIKIYLDEYGFGIYKDDKNGSNGTLQFDNGIKVLKNINLRCVLDDIKTHFEFRKNHWKLSVLEILADSVNRFEISEGYFIDPIGDHENALENIELACYYFESINKSNETVLEKMKNDLKTILLANRL